MLCHGTMSCQCVMCSMLQEGVKIGTIIVAELQNQEHFLECLMLNRHGIESCASPWLDVGRRAPIDGCHDVPHMHSSFMCRTACTRQASVLLTCKLTSDRTEHMRYGSDDGDTASHMAADIRA